MKPITIISLLLTLLPVYALSQVTITDALLTNSETMKLKSRFSRVYGSLHKTSFGPFETVTIREGKEHLVGRRKDIFLEIRGKNTAIRSAVSKIKSQPYALTILQTDADTIISNISLTIIKGGNHALVEINSGKSGGDESSISYCEDIEVQIKTDSLVWHMPPKNDQHMDYDDYPLSFDRTLTNGVDKIMVVGAEGFPVKHKLFKNSTRGIVFFYNKKQIAALETYPETAIWFSNDINERHKQVIAAVMLSLLSSSNSMMR